MPQLLEVAGWDANDEARCCAVCDSVLIAVVMMCCV
jgi:hypothetical protein